MPLDKFFSLGEIKLIQVFREVVRDQNYFDENGKPIPEKINTLLKEIDLGLWDNYGVSKPIKTLCYKINLLISYLK